MASATGSPSFRSPIRLRHVIGALALALAAWWGVPRLRATLALHDLAPTFADYALCMVGPTGPTLLRDRPSSFKRLVRQRLVASPPEERPFNACAAQALALTGSKEVEAAHKALAVDFTEWGGEQPLRHPRSARPARQLSELAVGPAKLASLARDGWPFVRTSYQSLVTPSFHAKEAVHPLAPPRPALGSGLPADDVAYRVTRRDRDGYVAAFGSGVHLGVYRTRDEGVSWERLSPRTAAVGEFGERCQLGGDRSYELGLSDDGTKHELRSLGPESSPSSAELGPATLDVFALACDRYAAVAALRTPRLRAVALRLCTFRQPCVELPLPTFGAAADKPLWPLDVARMDGITVISTVMGDVVRTASSRDDGRTWTPFVVAVDMAEHPSWQGRLRPPHRLLALGDKLLLYSGAASRSESYPVLLSEDAGASFRTPTLAARPIALGEARQ